MYYLLISHLYCLTHYNWLIDWERVRQGVGRTQVDVYMDYVVYSLATRRWTVIQKHVNRQLNPDVSVRHEFQHDVEVAEVSAATVAIELLLRVSIEVVPATVGDDVRVEAEEDGEDATSTSSTICLDCFLRAWETLVFNAVLEMQIPFLWRYSRAILYGLFSLSSRRRPLPRLLICETKLVSTVLIMDPFICCSNRWKGSASSDMVCLICVCFPCDGWGMEHCWA